MRTLLLVLLVSALPCQADEPLDAATLTAKLDAHWKTRDDDASIDAINELIKTGNRSASNDYAFLWRAARFRWWVADGLAAKDKHKRMIAKEGWSYALRAVAESSAGLEGRYYVALNIAAYSQAVGMVSALSEGLERPFLDNLDFVLTTDAGFDRSGARTAKGRFYRELPWPRRDLKRSRDELSKAIAANPESLRNYLLLAQTLLKDGDAKGAKGQIEKVIKGDPAYDPPEARRVKKLTTPVCDVVDAELK